jgi:uncharacterized repeat protein (TIGR04076 family)
MQGGIVMKLIAKVLQIKGTCPIYRKGDKIVIEDGYVLNLEETDAVCIHSLTSLMPYYIPLSYGIDPKKLGLAKRGDKAYIQCLDPCQYTGGGTVTFELTLVRDEDKQVIV